MKILTFTTLYPNACQPNHGVFVENRLRSITDTHRVKARVLAPVPWFPSGSSIFRKYAVYSKIPRRETRFGIEIEHPPFPVVPKIGMHLSPYLLYRFGALKPTRGPEFAGSFDIIDAQYFYPDGVAAAFLARKLRKPLVITARGTDINLILRYRNPRRMITWAAQAAVRIISVCQALKDEMVRHGIADASSIEVIGNGVDLHNFRPRDQNRCRRQLGVKGPILVSVGHLTKRKGHDYVLRALPLLPEATLLIAGAGEEERRLHRLARELGILPRVRFLGQLPHNELPRIYSAADILVLASDREGWPNVLLEAMACGTPVVATSVWGSPEIVTSPAAGILVENREPATIANAIRVVLANPPRSAATRAFASLFSWSKVADRQIAVYQHALASPR